MVLWRHLRALVQTGNKDKKTTNLIYMNGCVMTWGACTKLLKAKWSPIVHIKVSDIKGTKVSAPTTFNYSCSRILWLQHQEYYFTLKCTNIDGVIITGDRLEIASSLVSLYKYNYDAHISGPLFTKKKASYCYMDSRRKPETVQNGDPYTGKERLFNEQRPWDDSSCLAFFEYIS